MQDSTYTETAGDGRQPASMVSSADVNGTDVYSPAGDHLGHVDHLMIDKSSGNIAYAVMSFGGFLGIGAGEHPLPWKKLAYDAERGGYVTDVSPEQLQGAPVRNERWYDDPDYARDSYTYYGISPYWL